MRIDVYMLETMFSIACVNPNFPPLSPIVYIEERGPRYGAQPGHEGLVFVS